VTALMLLCITGTGLTWWNYSRHVFSTAEGIVLESQHEMQKPQHEMKETCFISISLPPSEAESVKIGHAATITVGADTYARKARVTAVIPEKGSIILRLLDDSTRAPMLPAGTKCAVTIDTTVPPLDEQKGTTAPASNSPR